MGRNTFALGFFLAAAGCFPPSGPTVEPDDTAEDLAEYDALAHALEAHRRVALGEEADELDAAGDRLFWVEWRGLEASLHSLRAGEEHPVDYEFAAGDAHRASADLVVTATVYGEEVVYDAYDADSADEFLGETWFEVPADEQRFWAFAVTDRTVYIVTTGTETAVHRWSPGGDPELLLTLEDLGVEVGIFEGFLVSECNLVFVESGRIWWVHLVAREAMFLDNDLAVTGRVSADCDGVVFGAANGPYHYDFDSGELTDIAAAIAQSGYYLNETFRDVHLYAQGALLHRGRVYYIGQRGVFLYDIGGGQVHPLLLEPRFGVTSEVRVDYRDPEVRDDDTLFVVGLESESGAVGVDGPVYAVRVDDVL